MACSRALRGFCVWRASRVRVFGILYLLACMVCLCAWRASQNGVLGILQKIGVLGVLHKMSCLACFIKWRVWCAW